MRVLDLIMTNPPKQDSQASIAGEPALVQNNKNYPPIGHRGHENIPDNVEKQAEKNLKKPRKIMAVIQVLSMFVEFRYCKHGGKNRL